MLNMSPQKDLPITKLNLLTCSTYLKEMMEMMFLVLGEYMIHQQ
ncbi:9960_t:CDS:1, partial [Paraglomus occultum]